jgi:hypothetical protein
MNYTTGPIWYLCAAILPVENEDVLVYDYGAHYIAWVSGGQWYDAEGRLNFSLNAYWTDLPSPPDVAGGTNSDSTTNA